MKNGKRWRSFIAGMVTMALLLGVGIPVLAAGGLVTLNNVRMGGIKIVIDGDEIHPTDANGKTVEPMIYNGTTYLPVRAVASALGKAVYWDGPNFTVYLGEMDGRLDYPTVMLKDMTSIEGKYYGASKLVDNYGNSYGTAHDFGDNRHSLDLEYLLNMQYSRFKGVLYVPEGTTYDSTCVVTITADGKQIYSSPVISKTTAPINLDVNVTGCNDFKISCSDRHPGVCLADAGFYQ